MQLDQMYQEIILDHYRHPHGRGLRDPFDAESHQVNPTCGDEVTLRVQLEDADGAESPTCPTTRLGCSISQAVDVGADRPGGRPDRGGVVAHPGRVPGDGAEPGHRSSRTRMCSATAWRSPAWRKYPARVKCALLGWMAFKDAVAGQPAELPNAERVEQIDDRRRPTAGHRGAAGMPEPPAASGRCRRRRPRGGDARRRRPRAGDQRGRPGPGLRHPRSTTRHGRDRWT